MAEASAPGKLVICGEYAVLTGAPAIAVAVDVRAAARVSAVAEAGCLSVAGAGAWPFDWQADGTPGWHEAPPAGEGRALEAVAATLAAHGIAVPTAVAVSLDTRAFYARRDDGSTEKLGLGSSAAVVVALGAALLAELRHAALPREMLLALCLDAHRRFQRGQGSGVDVAAAVHGGVVTLENAAAGAVIRSLAWPGGLAWLAIWTGSGASTPEMIGRFDRFRRSEPARFNRQLDELSRLAASTVAAWERAALPALLRSLADYDDALRALDEGAHIGIYTPAHERFAREAQAAGAVYKISGAGGGDFGIAFAADALAIEALRHRWAAQGFTLLGTAASTPGVVATP